MIDGNRPCVLHKKFISIYLNCRLSSKNNKKEISQKEESATYKPLLSARTNELAEKARKKLQSNI